jgi:hypothetical protein
MALLAFDDPAASPLADLLSPQQRERAAAQLNAAVLSATGQEREARLPGLLRLVIWAQRQLSERAEFPAMVDLATARLSSDPAPPARPVAAAAAAQQQQQQQQQQAEAAAAAGATAGGGAAAAGGGGGGA